jgi:hypothetical protein
LNLDAGSLIASFVVSSIGFVLFMYGKRMKRGPQLITGLILMIYPYFVPGVWAMLGIAVALLVLLYVALARGSW